MTRSALDVWLYDTLIGRLSETRPAKLRLEFTAEAERRFRPGSLVLSLALPIDASRSPKSKAVRAFFSGLLPEGDARDTIADLFAVSRNDHFGLLGAIGRECAGAVILQPAGSPPPSSTGRIELLGDRDLESLVADLRGHPLGADPDVDVRVSGAGVQEKLLLAKTADGRWGRPVGGAPSNYILKPQDMRLTGYAAAEDFCLRLARCIGLTDVDSSVVHIDGRPVLVVSRYDRRLNAEGTVERIHQEDVCQALAVDPASGGDKYQDRGGPSLKTFAATLDRFGQPEELSKLLALTTFNVAVGNADAHAKNLSVLHPPDGSIFLAPAYDLTPTTFYKNIPTSRGPKDLSDKLAMWINDKHSIHKVTAEDLVSEASAWGERAAVANAVVEATLAGIAANLDAVAAHTVIPDAIVEFVSKRVAALQSGAPAGRAERPRRAPRFRYNSGL